MPAHNPPRLSVRDPGPAWTRAGRWVDQALGVTVVGCLAVMVVLVFVNVVLRYMLNSGISLSDELARFLFVWMTFLGAILGLRNRQHAGMTMVRDRLGAGGQRALDVICEIMIIGCSVLMVKGAWSLALSNHDNISPLTRLPMSTFYGIGGVTGAAFILISGARLIRLLSGRAAPAQAVQPVSGLE